MNNKKTYSLLVFIIFKRFNSFLGLTYWIGFDIKMFITIKFCLLRSITFICDISVLNQIL